MLKVAMVTTFPRTPPKRPTASRPRLAGSGAGMSWRPLIGASPESGDLRQKCEVLAVSLHHGLYEHPSPEHRAWARAAVEDIDGSALAYGVSNLLYGHPAERIADILVGEVAAG